MEIVIVVLPLSNPSGIINISSCVFLMWLTKEKKKMVLL